MWKSCDFDVFKTGSLSVLCHFCLFFLRWVIGVFVFNSPVATPAHRLLGLSLSLRLRFISENTSLLFILMPPPTVPLH